jgi:hypothetical protein
MTNSTATQIVLAAIHFTLTTTGKYYLGDINDKLESAGLRPLTVNKLKAIIDTPTPFVAHSFNFI